MKKELADFSLHRTLKRRPMSVTKPVQSALFEEDFIRRSVGSIARQPDAALTELVANGWDAGASRVSIVLPDTMGGELSIEDDGTGLSEEGFRQRWMRLSYDRIKRQGANVEFPPGRQSWKRRAFGRNGVGRHGLLCFADSYLVETYQSGVGWRFQVKVSSGTAPFVLQSEKRLQDIPSRHGTRLVCHANRSVPRADEIREILSARFIHDPQFTIVVNGVSLNLTEIPGVIEQETLEVSSDLKLEVWLIDTEKAAKTKRRQGISFWVDGRLVGEPAWGLPGSVSIDGRTTFGKRYSFIFRITSSESFEDVLPDWSGFRRSPIMDRVYQVAGSYVQSQHVRLSEERMNDTKEQVYRTNLNQIRDLPANSRVSVARFVDEVLAKKPTLDQEILSSAVQAIINLEGTRTGKSLLEKLAGMSDDDIDGLDRLLAEWTVSDALTVLDEIDRRLAVIEAIDRFEGDSNADELHTLHPLVTQSRWLFGPEFESAEYSSNLSLRNAVAKVFGERIDPSNFLNARRRPDLLSLRDSTLSACSLESFSGELVTTKDVLLIELKKGRASIGRDEMRQAEDYVQDIRGCGLVEGLPRFQAFVVGHSLAPGTEPTRKLGADDYGLIRAVTYTQLTRTADKRLFKLRQKLKERYSEEEAMSPLLARLLKEPVQAELFGNSAQ